ncbi:hypothetical protein [Pulveribacter sp.]|uniref:hypothetical protein n=1 Tax=Pulveribacter sp. TaxID=2678893 RepID=UPI0028B26870|nr:hypothetical protein [Pulveribacter sp.]
MKREPPFKPHPTRPGEFLCNLAGSILIAGDAAYGDPAETTPEGQAVSRAFIERFLKEAAAHGFRQADTLHALLRRNQSSARIINLATDAMNCIPMELRKRIIEEEFNTKCVPMDAPLAPDYPSDALRPGPDGVDPRFWAAGDEIERVRAEHGEEAIHRPEYGHLFAELRRYAPPALQKQMSDKARELGLLPEATHVNANGRPVYSLEQVAAKLGTSVQELERLTMEHADELEALGGLHTGPVHPLQ